MDALPFLKKETIKQEPSDVPLNFLYPNDTVSGEPGPEHDVADRRGGAASEDYVPNLLSSRHGEPSDCVAVAESREKRHDIPVKAHKGLLEPPRLAVRISEKSQPVRSDAIDDTAEQHVFIEPAPPNLSNSIDSSLQPACSTLDLFQPSVVGTNAVLVSTPNEKAAGSKEGALNQLQTVIRGIAIPVEELSAFEQFSVKTDEVFIPDDMNGQTTHAENDSRSQQIQDERHTAEVINNHKGQSGEKDPQQTQSHSPVLIMLDSASARRMKHKICERKRTMTTRTSTGSLPKACRIQGSSERGLLKGLGMKIFSCSICNASFTQRSLLKKHVSEAHQGKPSPGHAAPSEQPPVSITLACPLCDATYKRKYGLKRHFASRHIDAKNIPCPECSYKAKKVQNYLRHIDKHKPVQSKCLMVDGLPVARDQPGDLLQFKCFECHQVFERNDALNLHIVNHKAALSLSKAESATMKLPPQNSLNCTCLSSDTRNTDGSTLCVLHSSSYLTSSSDTGPDHQVTFGHLPRELKITVEQSLDFMSKLASRLESLAGSINPDSSSSSSIGVRKSLLTMNHIRLLSTELTGLTTSVGNSLLNQGRANSKSGMAAENTEDSIAADDVAETDSHKVEKADEEDAVRVRDEELSNAECVCKKNEKVEDIVKEVGGRKEIKSEHTAVESLSTNVRRSRRSCAGARMKLKGKVKEECKTELGQAAYDCQECGRILKDLASLKRHMLIHRNVRPFRCLMCKTTFRRREHLKRHMVKHSQERPFRCDMCTYAAKTAKALRIHTLTHGEAKRLPCSVCSYNGRTPYELAKHERKHNPCSLCGYVANDGADFQLHRRSHLSYSCTKCSYSCHSGWQLRRHTRKHDIRGGVDDDGERYCCELCGYSCLEKRQFTYHMARHENKTPFSCPECDYKCSSRTSIDAHKLMHAGQRPFLCSFCGASFRRTSHLNNHMLIHKEEKKHVCRTCDRPFRARHNLKMHEMIHTGEKHHKCHLCNFACRRNKELRLHLAKHTTRDGAQDGKSQGEAAGDLGS